MSARYRSAAANVAPQVVLARGRLRRQRPELASHRVDRHYVWVRLCASIPRVTMDWSPFTRWVNGDGTGRWAHLSGGDAALLSSHAGRSRASRDRQKAWCPRRHGRYEPNPGAQTSLTLNRRYRSDVTRTTAGYRELSWRKR
jgi:hypothetical protein